MAKIKESHDLNFFLFITKCQWFMLYLSRYVILSFLDYFTGVEITCKIALVDFGSVQPDSVYYSENLLMFLICKTFKLLTGHISYIIQVFYKGLTYLLCVGHLRAEFSFIYTFQLYTPATHVFPSLFIILDSGRRVFLNWLCREYLYSHICCILWCLMVCRCNFTPYWYISIAC